MKLHCEQGFKQCGHGGHGRRHALTVSQESDMPLFSVIRNFNRSNPACKITKHGGFNRLKKGQLSSSIRKPKIFVGCRARRPPHQQFSSCACRTGGTEYSNNNITATQGRLGNGSKLCLSTSCCWWLLYKWMPFFTRWAVDPVISGWPL